MTHPLEKLPMGTLRIILLVAAAFAAFAVFLIGASLFAAWAATAVLLLVVPDLKSEIAPTVRDCLARLSPKTLSRIGDAVPYVVVGAVTLVALYPVSVFQMPVSQDHVNHYFGTHVLVHEMLPSGRIFGWTDSLGTGYPYGDIYHIVPYFLTGLLHIISFGLVPLGASYAFGITLTWLVTAFAAAAFARRVAGPWGAVLAGVLTTLDAGGDREGGWGYAMFHGVWPQHLATGIWLFALLALVRLYEKSDTRRLGVAALLVGLCLWLHPMSALILLLAAAVLFSVQRFVSEEGAETASVLPVLVALTGGGFIGLVWVIRMMVGGDVVYAFPSSWQPISALMARLLHGELFDNQIGMVAPLAMVGAVALALRRRRFDLFLLLTLLLLLAVGSMDLIIGSDAGLFGGGIGLVQYRRFSIPAKPLFYAAAGAGLFVVLQGIADYLQRRQEGAERIATRVLLSVFAAPFVYSMIYAAPGLVRSPAARPLTLRDTDDAAGLAEVKQVLEAEKEHCKAVTCTAVYWEKPGHGGLYPVLSFADLDYRWLPMLKLPANNFDFQGVAADVRTMARLGATVAVSKWKQTDPGLKLLGHFGKHYVYRIASPADGRVELEGPGAFRVERWSPEHREISLSGTRDESVLTLLAAPYKKWSAHVNGRPVALRNKRQGNLYVTEATNLTDGTLVLTYSDTLMENLFCFVGLAVFFGAAFISIRRPRSLPGIFERAEPFIGRIVSWGLPMAAALGLIALFIAGHLAATRYWTGGESSGTRLLSVLHERTPDSVRFSPENVCVRPYTRDPHFECAEHDLAPALAPSPRRRGLMPSCLSVGMPESGQTHLTFELPKGTTTVKGLIHRLEGKPVVASISSGEGQAHLDNIEKSVPFSLNAEGSELEFILEGEGQGGRACIEAVALSVPR